MMKLGFSFDANSCHRAETERLIFCIGIGLFVVFIVWAFFFVPMNNDEVNHFHTLACIYNPFSHIDASQMRGCDHRYDLTTPLGFVIERPLPYIGIFASLLYAPFYFIFHSAFVQYIFGLAFFGAFSVMISRLTAKPQLTFPLLLSFLPLAFNFIHDMGPVKYAMVTFPLSVWFFHKIVRSSVPNNYIYAILLALLLFMGVEEKPFYLYLLPGLGFFILAMAGDNWVEVWGRLCKSRYALLLGGAFFIVCLIILLFSMLPNQRYYITELILMMRGVEEMPMLDPGFSWGERWMRFVFFWPNYMARIYNFLPSASCPLLMLPYCYPYRVEK